MTKPRFIAGVFLLLSAQVFAVELQLSCKFNSEIKVSKLSSTDPEVKTTKISTEFLVYIDDSKKQASYINLAYKVKEPLTLDVTRSEMITLIEKSGSDNHFSLSIFRSPNGDGSLPAVRYTHAWNPKIDFYAPAIVLGNCRKIS